MKHIRKVSRGREGTAWDAIRGRSRAGALECADAKGDFMNAIWRAWSDYVFAKKNEVSIS